MYPHLLSRRQWLRSGPRAAAGTLVAWGLSACGRPRQASLALPTLVVGDPDFIPLGAALARAWDPRRNGAYLRFGLRPGTTEGAADIVQIYPGMNLHGRAPAAGPALLPLRSYLADANFDLSTLVPGVIAAWTGPQGNLLALPIQIAEYQLYVNHARLAALGFREPGSRTWAFAEMRSALNIAVAADPGGQAPLVVGAWDDPNFVGAAILGFGGAVRGQRGRLNLGLAAPALREFIDFVRQVRWPPASLSNASGDFLRYGFTGRTASALFAFVQPWSFLINSATQDAVRTMDAPPFPAFPARRVIPGFGAAGLAVNRTSAHPDAAVRFLVWLLQPAQQRLLASHGWPPVILDPATAAFWQRVMGADPHLPRFDPNGYVSLEGILSASNGGGSVGEVALQRIFEPACARMYQGQDVAAELAAVQRAIAAPGTG